jgi:hypothetical protein
VRRRLLTTILPGLVIAGCFIVSYMVRRPTSGVDVRAVACCPDRPLDAALSVRRPGRLAVEAGTRTGADGKARLVLQPGRYVVRGRAGSRLRARRVTVLVRDDTFESITVRFRPRPPRA